MPERTVRTRVGVSKTSTGKMSFDSTVEITGTPTGLWAETTEEAISQREMALRYSDALVEALRERYPAE